MANKIQGLLADPLFNLGAGILASNQPGAGFSGALGGGLNYMQRALTAQQQRQAAQHQMAIQAQAAAMAKAKEERDRKEAEAEARHRAIIGAPGYTEMMGPPSPTGGLNPEFVRGTGILGQIQFPETPQGQAAKLAAVGGNYNAMAGLLAEPELKQQITEIGVPGNPELKQKVWTSPDGRIVPIGEPSKAKALVEMPSGPNEFLQTYGKKSAEKLIERQTKAEDASKSITSNNEALEMLDQGMATGSFANLQVAGGKLLQKLGFSQFDNFTDNAQAYAASSANRVAAIIKQFGAGTGLSDADREYAEKAAAGNIEMTAGALRKIIQINNKANIRVISEYNKRAGKIPKGTLPYSPLIEVPRLYKSPSEMTDEEIRKGLGL